MEADSPRRPKKRARTESVNIKESSVESFDESQYHYYKSRAEHTVKIANEQIKLQQQLDE